MKFSMSQTLKKFIPVLLFALVVTSVAHAEKMDLQTHTVLIEKLKQVVGLSEEGVSRQNMTIRLADLYSERARLYAMQDEGKGEVANKKEIESDRTNAIALYETSMRKADNAEKGKILLQMAQLHQLLGHAEKSKSLYDTVIRNQKKYDSKLVAQAYIEAGEYEFSKANFSKARKNYESALKIKNAARQGYAKYRIAWCDFQMGNVNAAVSKMVVLLKNPDSFKKIDGSVDSSFQEEASRDLATFYARKDVNEQDVKILNDISPANVREANLTYLATELDRTGKKKSALHVWALLGTQKRSTDDTIEGQIHIAKIQYDLGHADQTVIEITRASQMLKEADCDDEAKCKSLQQQLRKVVTDWGQAEERTPSTQLIASYKAYLINFSDMEMNYWAGIAAQKRKQWTDSFTFYKNSAEISYEVIHDSALKSKVENVNKIFEGSLLGSIEAAEQAKSLELRDQAYTQYLKLNPQGEKALDVQYQVAQLLLEKGENAKAATKFKEIALTSQKGPKDLKDKSADLALDTLVVLKDEETLEAWSLEFATKLPARKKEFLTIARKSILNQAANVINTSTDSSALQKQFDKLSKAPMSDATQQEKLNFQKHRLLIATKLKNLDYTIISSQALLKEKGLSEKDQHDTQMQLAWAYEMQFDFKNAVAALKNVNPSKDQKDEHILKLGVMSELAGKDPTPYYEQFMTMNVGRAKKQEVALSLVRIARNKTKTFKRYEGYLVGNPKLYVTAGLYAYDEKPSESLKRDLIARGGRNTFEAQLLNRQQSIADIQANATTLARHKIRSSSPSALKKSLNERLALIAKFDKIAQHAIDQKDFTLQFLSLSVVATENNRIAQDIVRLPVPRGLNAQMKSQYKTLINQQVSPYIAHAKEVKKKMDELWDQKEKSAFNDVLELSAQSTQPGHKVAQSEVGSVIRVARKFNYSLNDLAQNQQPRQKLSQELSNLQTKVQKNPFDSSYIEKMKEIEGRLGRGPMVAYLDARLSKLKTGGQN